MYIHKVVPRTKSFGISGNKNTWRGGCDEARTDWTNSAACWDPFWREKGRTKVLRNFIRETGSHAIRHINTPDIKFLTNTSWCQVSLQLLKSRDLHTEVKVSLTDKLLLALEGFTCSLELVRDMAAFPKASISPWWSVSFSLPSLFSGYSHLRKPFHFSPAKLGPSSIAGSEEGKILSCLTFCKKLGQISEVNHHEWSHLRVRPAMPLCGWITRPSELLAEETAGDSFCFVTLYDLPYGPDALHGNVLLCKKKQIITRERGEMPALQPVT